jgi:hypothetical protein
LSSATQRPLNRSDRQSSGQVILVVIALVYLTCFLVLVSAERAPHALLRVISVWPESKNRILGPSSNKCCKKYTPRHFRWVAAGRVATTA